MKVSAGRYSKVSRRIHVDEKVAKLSRPSPNGFDCFMYLLTAKESSNVPGLFMAYDVTLAKSLQWPLKGFREAFAEVYSQGLGEADFDAGLVWIPNAIKHNEPESPNVVLSWVSTLADLPDCSLKAKAFDSIAQWAESKGEPWAKAWAKACPKAFDKPCPNQEQEQEQEQEQDPTLSPTPKASRKVQVKSPIRPDWMPSQARVDAIVAKTGATSDAILRQVPEFRLYWLPGGKGSLGKVATKRECDWEMAFSNRIDQLIEWGKLTIVESKTQPPVAVTKPARPPQPSLAYRWDGTAWQFDPRLADDIAGRPRRASYEPSAEAKALAAQNANSGARTVQAIVRGLVAPSDD